MFHESGRAIKKCQFLNIFHLYIDTIFAKKNFCLLVIRFKGD